MKNYFIFNHTCNSFLQNIYFGSITHYMNNQRSVNLKETNKTDMRDSLVILPADIATPEIITKIKNNGNKIVVFDINDNSVLSGEYRGDDSVKLIDMIFKISGLQQTDTSKNIYINSNLAFEIIDVPFSYSEKERELYKYMRDSGRIEPLPHVLWAPQKEFLLPWEQKKKIGLVRGGNHYYRYLLYLSMLRDGLVDSNSQFMTADYFNPGMVEKFRYCNDCIKAKQTDGKVTYKYYTSKKMGCNNQVIRWQQGDLSKDFFNTDVSGWNNRCIPMFYWLTEQFAKTHGAMPMNIVEESLNGKYLQGGQHLEVIANYLFYADYKWTFSIYTPPRFWEAAAAHSINLVPRFTNDQTYFPVVNEGDHYITYKEDMSDLKEVASKITKKEHDHITKSNKQVYDEYIKPDRYRLNSNTMAHIWKIIENKVL